VIGSLKEVGKLRTRSKRNKPLTLLEIFKMRTELKAKFIQHLNRKQSEKGFTLVELLVVIIIIGILAAIALPNFLNQGAKAKQTEAKQNIGLINRTQTAFRSENNSFASAFDILATGTLTGTGGASTSNYSYTLVGSVETSSIIATARDGALKGYSGGNTRFTNGSSQSVVASVVCEANTPGSGAAVAPTTPTTAAPTCASGYTTLGS
jgi:type IV pilus assembly protein PilA